MVVIQDGDASVPAQARERQCSRAKPYLGFRGPGCHDLADPLLCPRPMAACLPLLSPTPPSSGASPAHTAQVLVATPSNGLPACTYIPCPLPGRLCWQQAFCVVSQRNLSMFPGKERSGMTPDELVPKKVGCTGVQDQSRYNGLRKMAEPYQRDHRLLIGSQGKEVVV